MKSISFLILIILIILQFYYKLLFLQNVDNISRNRRVKGVTAQVFQHIVVNRNPFLKIISFFFFFLFFDKCKTCVDIFLETLDQRMFKSWI